MARERRFAGILAAGPCCAGMRISIVHRTTTSPPRGWWTTDDSPVAGFNWGATTETNEPDHSGHSGGLSVWYRWTAPANGSFELRHSVELRALGRKNALASGRRVALDALLALG
jgi:hypothetical protein